MTAPAVGLFPVIDAIVTTMRATAGYGAPSTDGVIPVFDGPTPTDEVQTQYVVIGSNGSGTAGMMRTSWLAFGSRADRLEEGDIHCLLSAWSGETDIASTLRGNVKTMLDDLATAAYTVVDTAIGEYTGMVDLDELQQEQSNNGLKVVAMVSIHYQLTRA